MSVLLRPFTASLFQISENEVSEKDLNLFHMTLPKFHQAGETLQAAMYDVHNLISNGNIDDAKNLLDIYNELLQKLSTEVLVEYSTISRILKPDSLGKFLLDSKAVEFAKVI